MEDHTVNAGSGIFRSRRFGVHRDQPASRSPWVAFRTRWEAELDTVYDFLIVVFIVGGGGQLYDMERAIPNVTLIQPSHSCGISVPKTDHPVAALNDHGRLGVVYMRDWHLILRPLRLFSPTIQCCLSARSYGSSRRSWRDLRLGAARVPQAAVLCHNLPPTEVSTIRSLPIKVTARHYTYSYCLRVVVILNRYRLLESRRDGKRKWRGLGQCQATGYVSKAALLRWSESSRAPHLSIKI